MSQSRGLVETEASFPQILRSRYHVWIDLHPDVAKEIAAELALRLLAKKREKSRGVETRAGWFCLCSCGYPTGSRSASTTAQITIMSNRAETIAEIINQRQPLVQSIADVEEHLRNLTDLLRSLDQRRHTAFSMLVRYIENKTFALTEANLVLLLYLTRPRNAVS